MNEEVVTEEEGGEQQEEQKETEENQFLKADLLNRFLAKFIDFLIIGVLATVLKAPFGPLAALTYSLISDGLFDGRSVGKKIIGLRVISVKNGLPCNYRDSILRNIPVGVLVFFAFFIPVFGVILLLTVGLVIVLFESYAIYTDESGIRIGDIFADTQVVEDK